MDNETLAYIEDGLRYFETNPKGTADAKTYIHRSIGLYTTVENYCAADPLIREYHLEGRFHEVYQILDEHIKQYLHGMSKSNEWDKESYLEAFRTYQDVARHNAHLFVSVNRTYVKAAKCEGLDVCDVYSLYMLRWEEYIRTNVRSMEEMGSAEEK